MSKTPLTEDTQYSALQAQDDVLHKPPNNSHNDKTRDPNIFAIIVSTLMWASLTVFSVGVAYDNSTIYFLGSFTAAIFLALLWIEVYRGRTYKYLFNMKETDSFASIIDKMRNTAPIITLECECFHYETRVRTVPETYYVYMNGQSVAQTRLRTELYQEKVVTCRGNHQFIYRYCSEGSDRLSANIHNFSAVRADFSHSWQPGNPETEAIYRQQYESFCSKYRDRDVYFSAWTDCTLPGFVENAMCLVDVDKKPAMLGLQIYIIFAIFTVPMLYRYWMNRVSLHAKFHFKKIIYL